LVDLFGQGCAGVSVCEEDQGGLQYKREEKLEVSVLNY